MKKLLTGAWDKFIGGVHLFEHTKEGIESGAKYTIEEKIFQIGTYLREHKLKGILFGSALLNYHFDTKKKVKDLDILVLQDYKTGYNAGIFGSIEGADWFFIVDRMLPNSYDREFINLGFNGSAHTVFELDPQLLKKCINDLPVGLYIPGKQVLHHLYSVYNNATYRDSKSIIAQQMSALFDDGGRGPLMPTIDKYIIEMIKPFTNIDHYSPSDMSDHGRLNQVSMTEIFGDQGVWVSFEKKIKTQLGEALEYKKKNKKQ
ncbi:MAG TPA: hypothetical protein PK048_00865 [Candidatus Absconditabacterales bacterium]|nr:hypothetical protein [Candidatus Absconditabacterales bacterium]